MIELSHMMQLSAREWQEDMRPQKTPAQLQPGDGKGNQSAAKLRAKAARGCRLAEPSNMTRRPPRLRALAKWAQSGLPTRRSRATSSAISAQA